MKKILFLALSLISLTSLFSSQAFAASAAAPQAVTGYFVFKNTGTEVTSRFVTLPSSNAAENQGKGVTMTVKVSADPSGKGFTATMIPQLQRD